MQVSEPVRSSISSNAKRALYLLNPDMFPDWLQPFFDYFPAYAWFFLGVGIPYALILLPRQDWRDLPAVIALGLALGGVFSTTWLFILGTWGAFSAVSALSGMVVLATAGAAGAWLRY